MSDLRLAFASTAIASLEWSEIAERPVDRVAASGRAKALGIALWKFKYQGSLDAARDAQSLLKPTVEARWTRDSRELAHALIAQALIEYSADKCLTCGGRLEVMIEDVKYVCAGCSGSGARRWRDTERAENMQLGYAFVKASAHKIAWILGYINEIDRRVNYRMNVQLGRISTTTDPRNTRE